MDAEEKELLYGITKLSANLVGATENSEGWFDHVIIDLKKQGADRKLIKQVENEKEHFRKILEYCEEVIDEKRPLDEGYLKKIFFEERKSHGLIQEITERSRDDELNHAGQKGLSNIDAIGNFTLALHEYRKIKGPNKLSLTKETEIRTDHATYLLNFQRKDDTINFNTSWFEKSDIAAVDFDQIPLDSESLRKLLESSEEPVSNSQKVFRWAEKEDKAVILPGTAKSKYYNSGIADFREEIGKRIAQSMSLTKYGVMLGGLINVGLLSLIIYNVAEYSIYVGRYCHMIGPAWFNSAILAEKMEYYAEAKSGGRPVIYCNLPYSKYGLVNFLNHPELRKFVIALHSKADYIGLNNKDLDKIKELRPRETEAKNRQIPSIQDIAADYDLDSAIREASEKGFNSD